MATSSKTPSKNAPKAKERKATRANAPSKGKKSTPKSTPAKAPKGPGVIGSIVEFLKAASKSKPLTREALLAKLVARFKDREEDSMRRTINCQLGKRIEKEQSITLHSSDEGYWAT